MIDTDVKPRRYTPDDLDYACQCEELDCRCMAVLDYKGGICERCQDGEHEYPE